MDALALQTEELDDAAASWLAERLDLQRCAPDDPRFPDLLARAQALIVRTYTIVDESLLQRAPNLRVVARAGVGLDNIDLQACRSRAVRVVSTPAANTQAVVELVVAFTLDALRPRATLTSALPLAEWKRLRNDLIAPRQLSDLTVGVLGMGRVGSSVARVFGAFGCRVRYHDLRDIPPDQRAGADPVDQATLLRESDLVSVHVDERASNRNLLSAPTLALLKPDALLINTSRGFVMNPSDLARWLHEHPVARAILDVHEPEPFPPEYPLLGLPNARLSPHIGAATARAKANMSWVVRDVWRVLNHEEPAHAAV